MLYARLVRAFPGHVILAQVALSQLLIVEGVQSRFRQLVADFVVCKPDFSAVAVVELDDPGERTAASIEKNRRKDRFLHAASVKVIRVAPHDLPSEQGLKALVAVPPPSAAPLMRRAS